MPTLSASQLEGSKPQLVAGLVAGTINEYAVLKVDAAGALAVGSTASLLVSLDHDEPGSFVIENYVDAIFAWPLVTQSTPIYDAPEGVFTLPQSGAYSLNYNIVAQLPDWVAGGIGLFNITTSMSLGASLWIKRADGITLDSTASIAFVASAGDQILLSTFNAMGDPGTLIYEYFQKESGINKINLYKL